MENYCLNISASGPGLSVDGGMAEYLLVPASRYLVPLADMSPVEAAPLTDAGLTPYHAIKMGLPLLVPGSYAVVIGAGGLGHLAVQFLKALSPATVISVDQRESALKVVADLGADHTVVAGPTPPRRSAASWAAAAPRSCSTSAATTTPSPWPPRWRRRSGRLTVVGVGGGTLPFNFFTFPYECSVQSTYWGSITELGELLALARSGDFQVHAAQYPLDPGHRRLPVDGRRHPPGPRRHRPQRQLTLPRPDAQLAKRSAQPSLPRRFSAPFRELGGSRCSAVGGQVGGGARLLVGHVPPAPAAGSRRGR